ncbi:TIGR02710 family CRISPR-associated CARF protein [Cylindrospermopsis curvispora]|uniref:TIGR02710 family CRISPR-associated protein n=1 Tax=Cylindrospermopsis curvispora GIHE-G1 TaxID=2666332 RepID=A0A7H0F3K3_9CYAN|nr:TIGR02710 family CRISPR-associated CARF protein [Cylindrospermopsis curvispora]QNP30619.1 TIGR02710 family CRISPR-associated protein [Cylindrospermopsis curvispora GIHE-G1]
MQTEILLVTVGGSHQPIVTAIKMLKPDRVVFICSEDSKSQVVGSQVKILENSQRLPNIPTQLELGDKFQPDRDLIVIKDPDNLQECYREVALYVQNLKKNISNTVIKADYTGGTKSMSIGLAIASIYYELELYVTTALRTNINRVERGEGTQKTSIGPIVADQTIKKFLPILLDQYNYPAIIAEVNRLLISWELPTDKKYEIRLLHTSCLGLDKWDKFEHREALNLLEPQMKNPVIKDLVIFLKRVIRSRKQIDDKYDATNTTEGHGYEIVEDLILNAERRAKQERYDDAVGRLYRALELLAQIRLLKEYDLKTEEVNIEKIPENLRDKYSEKRSLTKGKIQIGLRSSYELLSELNDPMGKIYMEHSNRIIDALEVRNNSLFAHGFKPIKLEEYEKVKQVFVNFIKSGISSVNQNKSQKRAPQFPTSMSDLSN